MPPEIALLFILLIIVKLILKRGLITTSEPTPVPTPARKPRKTRSNKGTRRVKRLPYADYELNVRESVQQFE